MFTVKILQKMTPPGLTSGGHCIDLTKLPVPGQLSEIVKPYYN